MALQCAVDGDGDLYGLGVRLGLYLQWLAGFLLRNFDGSWETISAVRTANNVLCSTLVLAIVVNTTKGTALPTDYLIVYYLTIALFYSESYHLLSSNDDDDDDDDAPGCYLRPDVPLTYQNLLFAFATIFGAWFWISGQDHTRPLTCGTPPKAALLATFDLQSHSWRKFAATFAVLVGLIFLFFFLVHLYALLAGIKAGVTSKAAIHVAVAFELYSGHPMGLLAMLSHVQQTGLKFILGHGLMYFGEGGFIAMLASVVVFQWFVLNVIGPLIAIVSVERMLRENNLQTSPIPESSGQMIALATGVAGFLMAAWD
ncbi:hypothetical protein C8A03DRAFT_37601, partial [Achaetomium macrosporum]